MVGFRGVIAVAFSTTSAAMSFAISATHDLQCSEIGMVCAHHNGFAFGVNNTSDAAALNAYIAALEKCDLVAVALREPAAIFHVLGLFSGVVIGVFLRYSVIYYSFPSFALSCCTAVSTGIFLRARQLILFLSILTTQYYLDNGR